MIAASFDLIGGLALIIGGSAAFIALRPWR